MNKILIVILIFVSFAHSQDDGIEAFKQGDYYQAQVYYEKVIKKKPLNNSAKFGLGSSMYKQEKLDVATELWNTVKNSDDPNIASKAFYNLGKVFTDQNKYEEGIAMYKKALELNPDDRDTQINYEHLKRIIKEQDQEEQDQEQQEQQEQEQQDQEQQDQEQQDQEQQDQEQQDQEQQDQEQIEKKQQAEAILDALKFQDKINQKLKISKSKIKILDKDW